MNEVPTGRRKFLAQTGLTVATLPLLSLPGCQTAKPHDREALSNLSEASWPQIQGEFKLDPKLIHLSAFLYSSPPLCVRRAIEHYRDELDKNPGEFLHLNDRRLDDKVIASAINYMGGAADEYILTESTTMGLALVYGGFNLASGQEILTSTHDHFSTRLSLLRAAQRTKAQIKEISLYEEGPDAKSETIVERIRKAITAKTRLLALTWVHSSTGVKLPVREIARVVRKVNERRDREHQLVFAIDGVHALGIEDFEVSDLGCDIFVAGCHKSLCGPRGTGLVWARRSIWQDIQPLIPSFRDDEAWRHWYEGREPESAATSARIYPGGFHSSENRWALAEAFDFHREIKKAKIAAYIGELATSLKMRLSENRKLKLITPLQPESSAGFVCFRIQDKKSQAAVDFLRAKNIHATVAPYSTAHARLAVNIVNSMSDIDAAVLALQSI